MAARRRDQGPALLVAVGRRGRWPDTSLQLPEDTAYVDGRQCVSTFNFSSFILSFKIISFVIGTALLQVQSKAFHNSRARINGLRIGELAIAGTHNAGAWRFDTEVSSVSRDSFVLCQDRSIWAQLVHGNRYFDFRVAYYDFYPNMEDR